MILTCPECATRFKINPDAIGANGRTVRCSQCSATWFVAAEPDVMELREQEENTLEAIQEREDLVSAIDNTPDPMPEESREQPDDGLEEHSPHGLIRDKAEKKKVRRRLFSVGMIWVTVLAILALAALAAILFRASIVKQFPGTEPIYKSLGFEASASGLQIYDVEYRKVQNEGTDVLLVNGMVKNYDRRSRDVSMIRLSFKNADGDMLSSWVVEPKKSSLASGESLEFVTQFPNPPVDAVAFVYFFVDENGEAEAVPMASQ